MKTSIDGSTRLRRAQLSDEVAGHLRAAIMSGTLRPGTFIRLDETAASLGVSATPVREALLTLRGEGMVQLVPNRGHLVRPLSREDIEDVFWLQATIARELAATAARRITDATVDELETLIGDLSSAVAAADAAAVADVEFAFHRTFNRAAERTKLAWFLLHVARYMPPMVYAADPQWGAAAVDNHRRLVAALRRRDTAEVVRLTDWQFADGARRLLAHLEASGIWA
ncbi:GntR family transcriptional regulator [Mycobacterium sp. MYCO198283]|uniref:GntR family transcriptional regulator n=1 Tax=Mycobacterium sp. MYCO198283 TaxID=2883505 RepID=UPI001E5EBC3E|nr:GntR family transcriptional regulator [Mycobacterium sp. MYCO198283]MCG5434505.1 GntR family transcriptional regulator [Mycobacterium sp. MYCO198283]